MVETDGPIENMLKSELVEDRYIKVDVETEYEP